MKMTLFTVCLALVLSTAACTRDEATQGCKLYTSNDAELEGCIIGATDIGPNSLDINEAKKGCMTRFDPRSIPVDHPHWFDQAGALGDQYAGCVKGAVGEMHSRSP